PCQCGCPADAAVTPDCCSRRRGTGRVTVTVTGGRGWRGDHLSPTDPYVRVVLGQEKARTATAWNQEEPKWGATLDLGLVALAPGASLRLEVWDEDNGWDDDLLGACEVGLVAGGKERAEVCYPGGGRLEFGYRVTCGRALGGPLCHDYVPQPPEGDGGLYRLPLWPPG
ncbi:PERF protein, partial [Glareola pratincola]|nr:PERF protein [Glareola pratincola]